MAVEEINANGGVLGRPIELVVRDSKGKPNEAAILFEELVYQEKIVAIVGPVPSDVGLAVARKSDELKVPVLLHKAASEKILTKDSRYTFRTAELPAQLLMQGFAKYVKSKGFSRIGAIVADYEWGHAIKGGIEEYIATLPDVQLQIEVAPVREADFTPYLRKMSDLDPELIIATGHPPGTAKITKQGLELGLKAKYLGIAFPKKVLESALGEKVTEGFLTHATVDFNAQEFTKLAEKFVAKYGEELDFESTTGYVNIEHIAWAIEQAGSTNPEDVASAIRNGSYETPLFVYPFAYAEWGDLKEMKVVIISFKPGPPPYYPDAISHVEVEFISPPLTPQEPQA
jgi:branched-chain amino acid transport system substrate-binding protein